MNDPQKGSRPGAPGKRIGQRELARQLGVSQSTISAVLNSNPSIRVAEETRQRILDAIRQHHYQPSLVANAVFDRPTRAIGVIYQGGYLQLGIRKLTVLVERIIRRGYLPLIYDLWLGMKGEEQCQLLSDLNATGVIVINGSYPLMYEILPRTLKGRVPVVTIDSPEDPTIPQIFTDREQGFRILADHLLGKGHRKIAVLSNRLPQVAENSPYAHANSLLKGVTASLNAAGLELAGIGYSPHFSDSGVRDPYMYGAVALAKLFDQGCRPDAVICSNDPWAIGALQECRRRGIRVPEDLAIVGFNDELQAAYAACPLTTVAPPVEELADAALDRLIGAESPLENGSDTPKLRKKGRPHQLLEHEGNYEPVILPCHLVIRESCGG